MISRYDIDKLTALPIEQVAERLSISVRHHKALCPKHEDSHPSLVFNIRTNRARCYVCQTHGWNTIDLVQQSQGWGFYEACQWLAQQFGIVLSNDNEDFKPRALKQQKRPIKEESREKPDLDYLSRLMCQPTLNEHARHFLYDERRISPEVVTQLGISSIEYNCPVSGSPRPSYFDGPALLIPYRDIDGNLLSVQSRYLGKEDEKTRFKFPQGSRCSIFNLPILKTCQQGEYIFIAEGVTDGMALMSAGLKAISIPSATLLSENDKRMLADITLSLSLRWCMYPDNDVPGESLFLQLREILPSIKRFLLPEGFKDLGQYWAHIKK